MRTRSGAIHCQTQEDFIHLSQISQNYTGIFYDEKVNNKVMRRLYPHISSPQIQKTQSIYNPQSNSSKKENAFAGFDFGLENQYQRQLKKQLQRMTLYIIPSINIGVINNDDNKRLNLLKIDESVSQNSAPKHRQFDLQIVYTEEYLLKFWLFDTPNSNVIRNPILQLYRSQCDIIIQIDTQVEIKIKNNKKVQAINNKIIEQINTTLQNTNIFNNMIIH